MIFDAVKTVSGIVSFRRKIVLSVIILFTVISTLTYTYSQEIFYNQFNKILSEFSYNNLSWVYDMVDRKIYEIEVLNDFLAKATVSARISLGKSVEIDKIPRFYEDLFRKFDIEFYYILADEIRPVYSEKLSISNNSVMDKKLFYDMILSKQNPNTEIKKVKNFYTLREKGKKRLYFISTAPIIDSSNRKVGTLLTASYLNPKLYSYYDINFSITNAEMGSLYESENVSLDQNTIPSGDIIAKNYIIYDRYPNHLIVELQHDKNHVQKSLNESLRLTVQRFGNLTILLIALIFFFVFYSINYILIRLRRMTRILKFINETNKIPETEFNKFVEDFDNFNAVDDFGTLNREFEIFIKNHALLFAEKKETPKRLDV